MSSVDDAIKKDLMVFYQKQFGHKWHINLHKQLVPSPFRFMSVVYNVPIDYIQNVYNQLVEQFNSGKSIAFNASL